MDANIEDVIISSFEQQEEELKDKLRKYILNREEAKKNKNVSYSQNFSNKTSPNNSTEINNSTDNSFVNTEIAGEVEELEEIDTEITGEAEEVEAIDTDFDSLITIVMKVNNGYELKHVNKDQIIRGEENKDYVVLVEWGNIISDDSTIDDVDNIVDHAKKTLKETLSIYSDDINKLNTNSSNYIFTDKDPNIMDIFNSQETEEPNSIEPTSENKVSNSDTPKSIEDLVQLDSSDSTIDKSEKIPSITDVINIDNLTLSNEDKKEIAQEEQLSIEDMVSYDKTSVANNIETKTYDTSNDDIPNIDSLIDLETKNFAEHKSSEDHPHELKVKDENTIFIGNEIFDSIDNPKVLEQITFTSLEQIINQQYSNNLEYNKSIEEPKEETKGQIIDVEKMENEIGDIVAEPFNQP